MRKTAMTNLRVTLAILLGASFAVGCPVFPVEWRYQAAPWRVGNAPIPKTVVVPWFTDDRPRDNSTGFMTLARIPLFPLGWTTMNVPEVEPYHVTSGQWRFNLYEEMAKATAVELEAAGIFEAVIQTPYKPDSVDGELVLQGGLRKGVYHGVAISYCIGFLSPILWAVGFPYGTSSSEIEVTFDLLDKKDGRKLWSKEYLAQTGTNVHFLYFLNDDMYFPDLAKRVLRQVIVDLRRDMLNASQSDGDD